MLIAKFKFDFNMIDYSVNLFLLLAITSSYGAFAQDLDCENLKKGVFISEVSEPIPMTWVVTRNGNQQIEELSEITDSMKEIGYSYHPRYEIIEWIDDCSYRLKYDESKFELSPFQRKINDNGGVLNQIVRIEGDCHYYISTLILDGNETIMEGKFCLK